MIPLKVTLVVSGTVVSSAIRALARIAGESDGYRIDAVITLPESPRPGGSARVLDLVGRIEALLLTRFLGYRPLFERFPVDTLGIPVRSYDDRPQGVTDANDPGSDDSRPDVLVNCTGRPLPPGLRTSASLGTIGHWISGDTPNRLGPAGFDEVLREDRSTRIGVVLELTGSAERGHGISGSIPTAPMYVLNRAKAERKAAFYVHRLRDSLAAGRLTGSNTDLSPAERSPDRIPDVVTTTRYALASMRRVVVEALLRLRRRDIRWGVGFQFVDDWRTADPSRSILIPNEAGHFLADPFVHRTTDRTVCFVEDFDFATGKGIITAYELTGDTSRPLGTVLEEPFHLSYPFVFESDGGVYMIPETHSAGEIRLYRCEEYPGRWTLHRVLMRDVSAAETNLHYRNGRWWMFTNLDSSDLAEHDSELHLFHADSYDSVDWTPHPCNPIIFDSARARNGGMVSDASGDLFRVFQRRGFGIYGEAVGISRVTQLTESAYDEEPVRMISADFFDDLSGAHTFTFQRGVLVVDFSWLDTTRSSGRSVFRKSPRQPVTPDTTL